MLLGKVRDVLNVLYPLESAESWDYPGVIVGEPYSEIKKLYFTVDVTDAVINDAVSLGANLIIAHHPLFFRPVHNVSGFNFRGAMVNKLISNSLALYCGHTNMDAAKFGVADSLAHELGLKDVAPLFPSDLDKSIGIGRIGKLPAKKTLEELAQTLYDLAPKTKQGIKVLGDICANVSKIALLPGSGDFAFDTVRENNADVYITSDLRHHPALDLKEQALFESGVYGGVSAKPFLIDVPHFSAEYIYLKNAAKRIATTLHFAPEQVIVSDIVTDPWDYLLV
jgi:dinuclear metal center YbgI/SA1388 family protein